MKFYYAYILQSGSVPEKYYTGSTDNLESRLNAHNQGKCTHTSKFVPWRIKTAIAFADRDKAMRFEKYLKTSSGRAFAKKTLIKPRHLKIISNLVPDTLLPKDTSGSLFPFQNGLLQPLNQFCYFQ